MTQETSYAIFQNVISELIKADIKFFASCGYTALNIDVYNQDVDKIKVLQLGFEIKVNYPITGETYESAHLILPVTENAVKAARQQNLSHRPIFID